MKAATQCFPNGSFTLLEILVSMALIAVLTALLIPSLNRTKELANRTKCMSNMRQIGEAMHTYAADREGRFYSGTNMGGGGFSPGFPGSGPHFFEAFSNYLKSTMVLYCPSAMKKSLNNAVSSYSNGVVRPWGQLRTAQTHYGYFMHLRDSAPANQVLIFENPWYPGHNGIYCNDVWILPELDYGTGDVYDQFGNVRGFNGLCGAEGPSDTNHGSEGCNVVYVDGHVVWNKGRRLKFMLCKDLFEPYIAGPWWIEGRW